MYSWTQTHTHTVPNWEKPVSASSSTQVTRTMAKKNLLDLIMREQPRHKLDQNPLHRTPRQPHRDCNTANK